MTRQAMVDPQADQASVPIRETNPDVTVRLYDNVDRAWVNLPPGPLTITLRNKKSNRVVAQRRSDQYLGAWVYKCSACTFTSAKTGDVEGHARAAVEAGIAHREARIVWDGEREACSACGSRWSRPGRGMTHLGYVKQMAPAHNGATEQYMRRYTLEPSVSVAVVVRPQGPAVAVAEPPAQVVGSVAGRKRKRHRHHNRGG